MRVYGQANCLARSGYDSPGIPVLGPSSHRFYTPGRIPSHDTLFGRAQGFGTGPRLSQCESRSFGKRLDQPSVGQAIIAGEQKYTDIRVPVLAIYANPHDPSPYAFDIFNTPAERAVAEAIPTAETEEQAEAFESGVPSARVVILPHANHYVFLSNEADVLREMRAFLAGLH